MRHGLIAVNDTWHKKILKKRAINIFQILVHPFDLFINYLPQLPGTIERNNLPRSQHH